MPQINQENSDFSRYIRKFCQLQKYKKENYLPRFFSRRVGDEFFAAMVLPYGLTNDFVSKLYYYETPHDKWAIVVRKTEEPVREEKETHSFPVTSFKQNLTAFRNGNKIFSCDNSPETSDVLYASLLNNVAKQDMTVATELAQMITGCVKIEESFGKQWTVKNIRDYKMFKTR